MTPAQLKALENLLAYVAEDEARHYEECDAAEREHHIYNDILLLQEFIAGNAQ